MAFVVGISITACSSHDQVILDDEHTELPEAGSTSPQPAADNGGKGQAPVAQAALPKRRVAIDLQKAEKLLEKGLFDELVTMADPAAARRLEPSDRKRFAGLLFRAADFLHAKAKDISLSSIFCERGLLIDPDNQHLMRLQIRNYLHPDIKFYGGAEELADKLIKLAPGEQENQLLRGKVAFEQGEWDVAVAWLERAARAGRQLNTKEVKEAWKLLDLARARAREVKAALSMTEKLEKRLKLTRQRMKELMKKKQAEASAPAGAMAAGERQEGRTLAGGDVVLYMTSWCQYCRKARQLLDELGVPYSKKDIEKDSSAMEELLRYAEESGVRVKGVPVVRVGSRLVLGYNPRKIRALVNEVR